MKTLEKKRCRICKADKTALDFYYNHARCKECYNQIVRERRRADPERYSAINKKCRLKNLDKRKAQVLKARYNLTPEELQTMRKEAGGLCFICKTPADKLEIDHDHTTGQVRKLLCHLCNLGLGQFKDNPQILIAAAEYLIQYAPIKLENTDFHC